MIMSVRDSMPRRLCLPSGYRWCWRSEVLELGSKGANRMLNKGLAFIWSPTSLRVEQDRKTTHFLTHDLYLYRLTTSVPPRCMRSHAYTPAIKRILSWFQRTELDGPKEKCLSSEAEHHDWITMFGIRGWFQQYNNAQDLSKYNLEV